MDSPSVAVQPSRVDRGRTKSPIDIVDCDVHPMPRNAAEIRSYLDPPWCDRYTGSSRSHFSNPITGGSRRDSHPASGDPAGSDPALLREQLLDRFGVTTAILMPRSFCNLQPDPDFGTAIAAAYNDWLAATWLDPYNPDGAFKGSIVVAHQDPTAAAREIDRWSHHPHFVQVMMDSGARAPYGQRQYWPIYEACERHGYPLAIHPGTDGMGINEAPTPGYPTHYIEWHTCLSLGFQSHLVSLITEGVFQRFPGLKVVLAEGGSMWLAPLMWRLDNEWKGLRPEVPWLTNPPSSYLADHVRLTSQPLERPRSDAQLCSALEAMNASQLLLFSSDYPHWDFDSPARAFPALPADLHNRIFRSNACELYGLH